MTTILPIKSILPLNILKKCFADGIVEGKNGRTVKGYVR